MRVVWCAAVALMAGGTLIGAQSSRRPAAKVPEPLPDPVRAEAVVTCPSELGLGVSSRQRFCDVLTGRDPKEGVLIAIPEHRGPVTLSFNLHNRHMYSDELIKAKRAFRQYSATIGVLTMDNTLIERAIVQSEFRSAADLIDRIMADTGPGSVKAVAPSGTEMIIIQLPEDVGAQVSLLGERLKVTRPDGDDQFTAPGRPIATISNVMLEYLPPPPPKPPAKAPTTKAPAKKTPAKPPPKRP